MGHRPGSRYGLAVYTCPRFRACARFPRAGRRCRLPAFVREVGAPPQNGQDMNIMDSLLAELFAGLRAGCKIHLHEPPIRARKAALARPSSSGRDAIAEFFHTTSAVHRPVVTKISHGAAGDERRPARTRARSSSSHPIADAAGTGIRRGTARRSFAARSRTGGSAARSRRRAMYSLARERPRQRLTCAAATSST